jgi:GT2 family glycosyltransferase
VPERTAATPGLVSVIIPCRDADAWLGETLASVFAQRVPLDVIVVDDGSTDRSVEIAERAGPVRVVRQPPTGVSAARNAGTAAAIGACVQYLDADDVLEPDTLASRLDALARSEADVVLTAWMRWERQANGEFASGPVVRRRLGSRPDVDLLVDAWWPPGAVLYRRAMVERIGPWRLDLPIIQDARFLLDAALQGATFAYVDAVGLRYRVHGDGSLSRRDPRAFIEDCYRSAAELHDRWRSDGGLDEPRRDALVRTFGAIARGFFVHDRSRFEDVLDRIHTLDDHYLPEEPRSLRALSGVIGYRSAEHVALWWRNLKGLARGHDRVAPRTEARG